jgi:hypothetical protein
VWDISRCLYTVCSYGSHPCQQGSVYSCDLTGESVGVTQPGLAQDVTREGYYSNELEVPSSLTEISDFGRSNAILQ